MNEQVNEQTNAFAALNDKQLVVQFKKVLTDMCEASADTQADMIKKFSQVASVVFGRDTAVCTTCAAVIDRRERKLYQEARDIPSNVKTWQGILHERKRAYVGC